VPAVQAAPVDLMAALKQSLTQKPHAEKKTLLRVVPKGDQAAAPKKSRRKAG
jgi:hypothetical protein